MQDSPNDNDVLELIEKTRNTDKEAFKHIVLIYSDMLHSILHTFNFPDNDYDDLHQEALVGLYKAVMTYDNKYSSFTTFAYICVKRSVISYFRKLSSKSIIPFNKVSSLSDEDFEYLKFHTTPESDLIDKEDMELFLKKTDKVLSPFEKDVLSLYLSDVSYADMSKSLGKPRKSIDNAIQRIRQKLRLLID